MTIPWSWILLALNALFGLWACFSEPTPENDVSKDLFPAGLFVLEAAVAVVWLISIAVKSITPAVVGQ